MQLTVPCREAALCVLGTLHTAIQLAARMPRLCAGACEALLAQVASSYFVPLCLSAAAVTSRLRLLVSAMLLRMTDAYTQLVNIAAMLPLGHMLPDVAAGASVYEAAQLTWAHGLPSVRFVDFSGGAQAFVALALKLAEDHSVQQHASRISTPTTRVLYSFDSLKLET